MKQYLVLDYGGSTVKISLMDENANRLADDEKPAPTASLEEMKTFTRGLAEEYKGKYCGVAISLPGIIDVSKGIAHTGSPYRFENGTHLAAIYEEIFGAPVVIANDGKCAANAELHHGALKGVQSGIIVGLGTGIAGGIIINGRVWTGSRGAAGELSFYPHDFAKLIDVAKKPLPELKDGVEEYDTLVYDATWESVASASALLSLYCQNKGIPFDKGRMNGREFFKAYDIGDEIAVKTLEEFAMFVAAGIFSLQIALDVERCAIGGGISVRPEVTEQINIAYDKIAKTQPDMTRPEIVPCHFQNGANQVGALMFYFEQKGRA